MAKKTRTPTQRKAPGVERKSDVDSPGKRAVKPGIKLVSQSGHAKLETKPAVDSGIQGSNQRQFPIVGIGASAGGLDAFTDLLRALPRDLGLGYVFVQHLDPKHLSILTEILGRETKLPVKEANDGTRVRQNCIYVIPSNSNLTINKGVLNLAPRNLTHGQHMSIDTFFRSLAEDQGDRAIGIILSGNASDGALGLRAIKAAGGITFAQDPQTARFDGMPRSAIASGCVDYIRPPAEIVNELIRIAAHPYVSPSVEPAIPVTEPPDGDSDAIPQILSILRLATGVDFTQYKTNTIRRRIMRRMLLGRFETADQYYEELKAKPIEVQSLFDDILINVTEFFRDPDVFQALETKIVPEIIRDENGEPKKRIRVWIPGCSTGEEAYSIAMVLLECLGDGIADTAVQIFATDVSEMVLERARSGIYTASISQAVSAERLGRFFLKVDAGYQIRKQIRDLCVFARHNLANDPPFSRLDLISCRNVLIYLAPPLQQRVIPILHYALKPNGFLLLGTSETVGNFSEMFVLADKRSKIYSRKNSNSRVSLDFGASDQSEISIEKADRPKKVKTYDETDLQREADRIVLGRYSPAGIVVDDDLNILQFRGHTSPFLEPTSGAASLNLARMAREPLLLELKNSIGKARKEDAVVRRNGIRLELDGNLRECNLEIVPLKKANGKLRRYLVLFETVLPPAKPERVVSKPTKAALAALETENKLLRQDLAATKECLQSIIEDQEATHEELRSAAEEIQSSNEELQSTNEELETAKEELQSTNEELNTVNEELQNRNLQLSQVGNDLLNLLSNVSMPIVIVGSDLRIRRFTPAAEKVLHLIPGDMGRPIRDINFKVEIPNLERTLIEVVDHLGSKTIDVFDAAGQHYSVRMRPYRTEDNKIDGVVMIFVDFELTAGLGVGSVAGAIERLAAINEEHLAGLSGASATMKNSRDQLRALTSRLLEAQEEERKRVSRELHDELNQKLALLELNVQNLENRPTASAEEVKRQLENFRHGVSELSEDLRRIAYQLHPSILDDLGLVVGLQSYCEEFSGREGIAVKFTHRNVPGVMPQQTALCLYRLVQESLRNIAKHSRAKKASVALAGMDSSIQLSIKDAGVGFDPTDARNRHGLGLLGMQERVSLVGGNIVIKSEPGAGTQVAVRIPLQDPEPNTPEGE
jgi:two-component system CheB/CheR fusion protein